MFTNNNQGFQFQRNGNVRGLSPRSLRKEQAKAQVRAARAQQEAEAAAAGLGVPQFFQQPNAATPASNNSGFAMPASNNGNNGFSSQGASAVGGTFGNMAASNNGFSVQTPNAAGAARAPGVATNSTTSGPAQAPFLQTPTHSSGFATPAPTGTTTPAPSTGMWTQAPVLNAFQGGAPGVPNFGTTAGVPNFGTTSAPNPHVPRPTERSFHFHRGHVSLYLLNVSAPSEFVTAKVVDATGAFPPQPGHIIWKVSGDKVPAVINALPQTDMEELGKLYTYALNGCNGDFHSAISIPLMTTGLPGADKVLETILAWADGTTSPVLRTIFLFAAGQAKVDALFSAASASKFQKYRSFVCGTYKMTTDGRLAKISDNDALAWYPDGAEHFNTLVYESDSRPPRPLPQRRDQLFDLSPAQTADAVGRHGRETPPYKWIKTPKDAVSSQVLRVQVATVMAQKASPANTLLVKVHNRLRETDASNLVSFEPRHTAFVTMGEPIALKDDANAQSIRLRITCAYGSVEAAADCVVVEQKPGRYDEATVGYAEYQSNGGGGGVIHAQAPEFRTHPPEQVESRKAKLSTTILNALRSASVQGKKRVVFRLLSTGEGTFQDMPGTPNYQSLSTLSLFHIDIVASLIDANENPTTIECIDICARDTDETEALLEASREWSNPQSKTKKRGASHFQDDDMSIGSAMDRKTEQKFQHAIKSLDWSEG